MKIEIIGLPKVHHRYVIAWIGEGTGKLYYWNSCKSKSLAEFQATDLCGTNLSTTFTVIDTKEE